MTGVDSRSPSRPERSLSLFAQALWGGRYDVSLAEPSAATLERSRFDGRALLLPGRAKAVVEPLDLARVAHASAHVEHSGARFEPGQLKPVQRVLVSLLEDARVEVLALRRYPGLRALWQPFHLAMPTDGGAAPQLMARLARALFDSSYRDPDGWVQKGRELFERAGRDLDDPALSRELGSVLGNDLGQLRLPFLADQYLVEPSYRDDHAGLWQPEPVGARVSERSAPEVSQAKRGTGASTDPAAEAPVAEATSSFRYPEWDYVIGRERADFCRVCEETRVGLAAELPASPAPLVAETRRALLRAERTESWRRRCSRGERLDLSALVDAASRALGGDCDERFYIDRTWRRRPRSTLLLLDLSASLAVAGAGAASPFSELRRLAALLTSAQAASRELAVHGFSSLGRERVRYTRFQDFGEPGSLKLRGLPEHAVNGSTRLGAAMRHATQLLLQRGATRKLLLVATDGEPADVDVFDERYLVEDARRASRAARLRGVAVLGLCLGQGSRARRSRIFDERGRRHFALLERLSELPRQLGTSYSRSMLASTR